MDYLRTVLHKMFELVGMFDADVQPSSLDDVLSMLLQFGIE